MRTIAWQVASSSFSSPVRSLPNSSATCSPRAAAANACRAPSRGDSSGRFTPRRRHQLQPGEPHRADRPRRTADIAGVRGAHQHEAEQDSKIVGGHARADWARMVDKDSPSPAIVPNRRRDAPTGSRPGSARIARRNPLFCQAEAMTRPAITIAVRAARAAGNVILRYMNRIDGLTVVEKQRMDFASEVDKLAEAEIVKELRRAYPDHGILAEESGAIGKKGPLTWVIDPLDGTHNYLRGIPHFSVSIAMLGKGENLGGAMIATGFPYRQRAHLDTQLAMTRALLGQAEDIRRSGSAALDLAYTAAGRYDGYFEIGLKPWDMAAGVLLVHEAGGRYGDFAGRDGIPASGNIIAGNLNVAKAMTDAIGAQATPELLKA